MTKDYPIKSPRKLIEVALPLDLINEAAAKEKSIRHGHPSMVHLWWARRPLAAARAVIFAQMVNDPGYQQGSGFKYGKNKTDAAKERQRLFRIIEQLVLWDNINNTELLNEARKEIVRSWREVCDLNKDHPQASELFNPDVLPGLHDPFAGGGALPLEAQRLGMDAFATDLNPVAVLLNKALIEIPPRFAGQPPVNPETQSKRKLVSADWQGASGLAEDVRYYGHWVREKAKERLGHIYPTAIVTDEDAEEQPSLSHMVGTELTVVAWIWARTVKSPNPAFSNRDVPLLSTFVLSSKKGSEVYLEPIVDGGDFRFAVRKRPLPSWAKTGTKLSRGANFRCILSDTPISADYIKSESMAKRIGVRLVAIVANSEVGRVYLPATPSQEAASVALTPSWQPTQPMNRKTRDLVSGRGYGFFTWSDIFTRRQLVLLTTLSDLLTEVKDLIASDARVVLGDRPDAPLAEGGCGARAYGESISVYLALAVDKVADYNSTIAIWSPTRSQVKTTFGRQAIPMTWDFAETNPFAGAAGDIEVSLKGICRFLSTATVSGFGVSQMADAQTQSISAGKAISTDPPYYDNIAYADLSDFFYIWLRPSLRDIYPDLFATMAVPKDEELVASAYRHGNKQKAETFFLEGID